MWAYECVCVYVSVCVCFFFSLVETVMECAGGHIDIEKRIFKSPLPKAVTM